MQYEVLPSTGTRGDDDFYVRDREPSWAISWRSCWPDESCTWSTTTGIFLPKDVDGFVRGLMRDPTTHKVTIERISRPQTRRTAR